MLSRRVYVVFFFFFNDTATTEIYTLSLHDALPIYEFLQVGGDDIARMDVDPQLVHRQLHALRGVQRGQLQAQVAAGLAQLGYQGMGQVQRRAAQARLAYLQRPQRSEERRVGKECRSRW